MSKSHLLKIALKFAVVGVVGATAENISNRINTQIDTRFSDTELETENTAPTE